MTTTPLPPVCSPTTSKPSFGIWLIRIPVLLIIGMMTLFIMLGTMIAALQVSYRERINPNVWVLGQNMAGLSLKQAASQLSERFNYDDQAVFTFRFEEQFWQVSAKDLGVKFDSEATAAQAFAIGHSGNAFADIMAQLSTLVRGSTVAPIVVYNQQQAFDQLTTIAQVINRMPTNASLVLEGTTVQSSEGGDGRALDITTTLKTLEQELLMLRAGSEISLSVTQTPPLVFSVADTAQQIQTALSAPVQLVVNEPNGAQFGPWTATTDQIAQLLRLDVVTNSDGTQSYLAHIDGAAFETYLQSLAPGLIAAAQNARYHFNDQTRQLEVIQPAMSERTLNIEETVRRLEEAVFSTDSRVVPMAFDLTLPRYHNQITGAELGITEMVVEATSYFSGSAQNRRTNIAVAASKFDGLVIAPGEEFSFNYYLGDISEEGGFVEGKVIVGDRTVIGIGGGACQVSTTLFRAAFIAGFAITERNSHGYRIGYYEQGSAAPGLDAAIWQPERDFKFQNNTPYYILIQTSVYPTNDALQFRFYSTPYFRTEVQQAIVKNITAAEPTIYEANADLNSGDVLQVEYSAEGADVTVYRTVYDLAGNVVLEDYVYTHYLPWGAIFQVAPGDSRLS